jgi:hypothetical protein
MIALAIEKANKTGKKLVSADRLQVIFLNLHPFW